jgi:hypothetical protein
LPTTPAAANILYAGQGNSPEPIVTVQSTPVDVITKTITTVGTSAPAETIMNDDIVSENNISREPNSSATSIIRKANASQPSETSIIREPNASEPIGVVQEALALW